MSDSHDRPFDLRDAYAVASPDDNRDLYRRWADTYESEFIQPRGYVYHLGVIEAFLSGDELPNGPILDVGCGTGIVAEALAATGVGPIDGVDISPEMLEKAREKRHNGSPVYRDLHEVDLTKDVDLASGSYHSVISVGAFTHGHLGPEPLAELIRLGAPQAMYSIGVKSDFFQEAGFEPFLAEAVAAGQITEPSVTEARVYTNATDDHADATARILTFTRI